MEINEISEINRLSALRSLGLLDTEPEERFDRLTRTAKRIFNVSIALVVLVDKDRQWFKSCIGLNVNETPREISFCTHAIQGNEPFIICDALNDELFCENPLVLEEPKIRFYAGVPLTTTNGIKLGTFCIIDTKPRNFDQADVDALKDVAYMAERELNILELAVVDELTSLMNRRGFIENAKQSLKLCLRNNISATLVYFDLDNFKPINDHYGHEEGDNALVLFAQCLKDTFRNSDIMARLGGDEFTLLLHNTNKNESLKILEKFHDQLKASCQINNLGYEILFTFGAVDFDPERHVSIEKLISDSDAAMFESKRKKKKMMAMAELEPATSAL